MKNCFLAILFSILSVVAVYAANVKGQVFDEKGNPLQFASIIVKGTTKGSTANQLGKFTLELSAGTYTLVCQHVGYQAKEQVIKIGKEDIEITFTLTEQSYDLKGVEVKAGGEDPAYGIIRKAIEKRSFYKEEIKRFETEVYIKGQLQLRDFPKKFLGQKVDFEDGDSSKRKMIFLSETVAKYSVDEGNKSKVEVLSTRVSGQSDGFGFSSPQVISFYENNISLGSGLNPRGFISPIAQGALNYYRYKFEGSFFENGIEVSKIRVIPRRKYEPLFSGYINIVEDQWRIHSLQLQLVKEQQMQFLDTLVIEQLYVPASQGWVTKSQVIYPSGKIFGFDFFGSFVQVYDKYNLNPAFTKKTFDNTVLKFADSSNKRPKAFWDTIRPLELSDEEMRDYKKKDSLEQVQKDPKYLDSLDKRINKVTVTGLLLTGETFFNRKKRESFSMPSVLDMINYNLVEGWVFNAAFSYNKRFTENGRRSLAIEPVIRYGTGNSRLNGYLRTSYSYGKKYANNVGFSIGSRVFQFNNANPILPRINTYYTLLENQNFAKLYEAGFLRASYSGGLGKGVTLNGFIDYQDRRPLTNLSDPKVWRTRAGRSFTDNYPVELPGAAPLTPHQALSVGVGFTWQPAARYIEYPERKVNIGSKYPTISGNLVIGLPDVLGSDVSYARWRLRVSDNLNLKLAGRFNYRLTIGGFLSADRVFLPDYQHFLGNQTAYASTFLNSFQLLPYYTMSNTDKFYSTAHVEYHLNGFLTNKIPGFKRLNWFIVTGANTLQLSSNRHYREVFIGLENIFKVIRIDFIQGFQSGGIRTSGIRFSTSGLLTGGDE